MSRSRNIKPGFFKNDLLAELPFEFRILFQGLWCVADREGRLEDRPKRIKAEVFPYDNVNVDEGLKALENGGFILRYAIKDSKYIQVLNFKKHQSPHKKEAESIIPAPEIPVHAPDNTDAIPVNSGTSRADSLIPDSLIPITLSNESVCSEPKNGSPSLPEKKSPVVIKIPMTAERHHGVTESDFARLRELYPGVDVMQSLRNMVGWLDADSTRRSSTERGVRKRIASWLARDKKDLSLRGVLNNANNPQNRECLTDRAARLGREADERELAALAKQAATYGDAQTLGAHVGDLRTPLDVGFRGFS